MLYEVITEIKSFSAREKSGLVIQNFSTQIFASNKGVSIPSLDLRLPASRINLEDVTLKYDSLGDLKNFVQKVKWHAPISNSYISFTDLKPFVPDFKNVRGVATLSGLITGRISNMKVQKLEMKYGKSVLFNADVDVSGSYNFV